MPQTIGNPGLVEDLLAYELGMRVQATERFSWDLATFYNQYDNLSTFVPFGIDIQPPFLFAQQQFRNGASAETYGVELATNYTVNEQWRAMRYTFINLFVHDEPGTIANTEIGATL
jgi:iron complex outermembrane receptor protein